ncbi:MAG: starch-binding protein [Ruminococcus sp.]|nr:starch-binding protein [Ruminococcus sp.]
MYLNNNSYFQVTKDNVRQESRALRLAFYQNDGNSGNVGSSLLRANSASDGGSEESSTASQNAFTLYFNNESSNWENVYAYFWNSNDDSNAPYLTAWPGTQMHPVSGKIYSITIDNPDMKYDRVIFSNNNNAQTATISLTSGKNNFVYTSSGTGSAYSTNTVYFLKPSGWTEDRNDDGIPEVYCHAWHTNGSSDSSYTNWPGDEMIYVGSGIYSYTYNSDNTGGFLFDNGYQDGTNQTADIAIADNTPGSLYYCTGTLDNNGKYVATRYADKKYADLNYNTIYLFNTYAWEKPYATVSMNSGNSSSVTDTEIAMVALSGNMYYCTVPEIFSYVSFHEKGSTAAADKTTKTGALIADQKVYRPKDTFDGNNNGHEFDTFLYSKYIKTEGYPVISPGVSAGFQRPYSPVITIGAESGLAEDIVPAYSNSIDNYILGSGTPLFVLEKNHMASLSMIMWLEGTDDACVGDLYPANTIDFKLEFSTLYYTTNQGATEQHIVNPGDSDSYTYNFYDKTRELWTSDRQSTESGVTVAPVMQLYDNTIKRGYLMQPSAYGSYDGKRKVSCWSVTAPQSIAKYGHDIIFRRVNPYNEDEVWNYWHAGPVAGARTKTNGVYNTYTEPQTIYNIAKSGTEDVISFTAFADGSPLTTLSGMSGDTDSTYKAPVDSCGGLWGNHTVRTVIAYDGLPNQPLKDNKGVLTINYQYTYTGGSYSPQVTVEYKASGPSYNSFYYFVVPNVAFANATPCSLKRYTGFEDKYAINSAENNPNITFVDYYGKDQQIAGEYFELNKLTGGTNTDYSYWGSDMLYVQTNVDTKNYVYTSSSSSDNNAKLFQVHFSLNGNFDDTGDRYVYLYYNGNFKPTGDGDGYACVVPNDRAYTKYRLENCSYNGSDKYNVSDKITVNHKSSVRIADPLNSSTYRDMIVNYLDQNGITTTYIGIRLYLQTNQTNGQSPGCYVSSDSNGEYISWPGIIMTHEDSVNSSGTTLYKYYADFNVSKFNKVIFAYRWNDGGITQSQTLTLNLNDVKNNMIYESKNTTNVTRVDSSTDNKTLMTSNDWTADAWPHLTFKES